MRLFSNSDSVSLSARKHGLFALNKLLLFFLFSITGSIAFSQDNNKITVTGRVTDSTGALIERANIIAVGKKGVGTTTDVNGRFVLDVDPGTQISISYIGYQTKTVTATATSKTFNVVLAHAINKAEDEVIITAYGRKQRKEAVVGSVTAVAPGDLKIPASNLTTALAGQVAGVIAYSKTGQPGMDNASFFVRGVTTFGYKQDPLILIDNVELTASDLARLQVDDIASFSILKDASATALYGARGANGVILVSTKEGKEGKSKINFRFENSFSQSAKNLQISDPVTYMNMYNEAAGYTVYDPNKIANTKATMDKAPGSNEFVYPAVNWMDMLFKKTTSNQRANMSVSGGGGVAKYYIAGSYNVDHGILKQDIRNNNNNNVNFKNYQLRANVNVNLTKTTEMIVRMSGNFNEYNGPLSADNNFSTSLYSEALHSSAVDFPAYFEPDSANMNAQHILFGNVANTNGDASVYTNPYASLLRGHKNFSESRMSAQLELNQNLRFITDGLTFRALFNTNRYSYFQSAMAYAPYYYQVKTYDRVTNDYTLYWINHSPGDAREYLIYYPDQQLTNINAFYYFQGTLDYNKRLGDHNVSGSLVGTAQQTLYYNKKDEWGNYIDPSVNPGRALEEALPFRNLGLAGRATYSYKNKYFAEFNFGYNGSERFDENHRFGFFPTIGASWIVSKEKFWEPLENVIDRFKVRASYGYAGNDAISPRRFFYKSDVNLNGGNGASFGTNNSESKNGVSVKAYPNPEITWETSQMLNLGVEMTLFKNINVVAEFFKKHTYNILQQRITQSTMGLEAAMSSNVGSLNSKGVDLSLDYKKNFNKDLWASVRANFTYSTNLYEHYEDPQWEEPWRVISGNQPSGKARVYLAERLFVDDAEAKNSPIQSFGDGRVMPKGGDIKYRDMNGDGVIDYKDMVFAGYPYVPEIVYGFGFSTGYKGFDLSAFFQGQSHNSFFIDPVKVSPFIPSREYNIAGPTQLLQQFSDNHWSESNQNQYAMFPRFHTTASDNANNEQGSTWWMRDGRFLRLKSLEVGYTLPRDITKRMHLANCRIYFNGMNLFTWSPFKIWDPELQGNGFAYPIQKVMNIGLNVNL
ncbi:SusC/RagA family TonB-linked outer membrane protein [Pinibacter aurantiacus]|uniref:TonB-dependent receptor n=1 Tax=Pinibacter aurantiacus TaxID=2851599 RepID=A0A9E2W2C4_9BACT|nr:TonB-dependent receptor [Pinibacter aurantiacus]MBV4355639.1 TonB-dependent receptor [Pinibacter aurantiacus]